MIEGRRSKGRGLTERRRTLWREMDRGTMKSMGYYYMIMNSRTFLERLEIKMYYKQLSWGERVLVLRLWRNLGTLCSLHRICAITSS
jgi:hypothetical protein